MQVTSSADTAHDAFQTPVFRHLPDLTGLILSVLLLCALCCPTWADTLYFKGDNPPVQGKIINISDDNVMIRLKDGTVLPISRSSIQNILFQPTQSGPSAEPPANAGDTVTQLEPLVKPSSSLRPRTPDIQFQNESHDMRSRNQDAELQNLPFLLRFPESNGRYNDDAFIVLSTFRGGHTHRLFAGLYQFEDKGTFWVRLPQVQHTEREISFSLFGKMNRTLPPERFTIKARFLDSYGHPMSESAPVLFSGSSINDSEWFDYLANITGVAGQTDVRWIVPPDTKTIEIQVYTDTPARHLVGYLTNVVVQDRTTTNTGY